MAPRPFWGPEPGDAPLWNRPPPAAHRPWRPYPTDSKPSPSPQDPVTVVSYSLKMAACYQRLGSRGVCGTGPKTRPIMVASAGPRCPDADPPSQPHRATAAHFGVSSLFSSQPGESLGTRKWQKPGKLGEGPSNSSPLWRPQERAQETGRAASRRRAGCRPVPAEHPGPATRRGAGGGGGRLIAPPSAETGGG